MKIEFQLYAPALWLATLTFSSSLAFAVAAFQWKVLVPAELSVATALMTLVAVLLSVFNGRVVVNHTASK